MRELEYPFDSSFLMRKRKSLKRSLLEKKCLTDKRIAILGGSTTHDIKDMLELFLLNYGIEPEFYESEYAMYWQDAMFPPDELSSFKPDIIFIHTSLRNITFFPEITDTKEEVDRKLSSQFDHFRTMWEKLSSLYGCPVIQNNFEYPFYRLLGNMDAWDYRGRVNFVSRLNSMFAGYAMEHQDFYINDINWISADYGLEKWSDSSFWHMYKYAMCTNAIPVFSFNIANIIKSIFGKNKKGFALDLDNTLWGGIVGDDGPENLEIGQETSIGQVYSEFQQYIKELGKRGIILSVVSKNEEANAMAGLSLPQMVLKPDDFISIKANWDPKSKNLAEIASELTLLPEAFVFTDDNPAEREIIRQQIDGAGVPELTSVEHYITAVDRAGYFEATSISGDDLKRNEMYKENKKRASLEQSFADYDDYLRSLEMKAEIGPFTELNLNRIAQLTNKSNQFNLTTRRYTRDEIDAASRDENTLTLSGNLDDCFGSNGLVALTIAEVNGDTADIILWLMSCRVLKRGMEFAMMDETVRRLSERGVKTIRGHYYPTAKNGMVKEFYSLHGFAKTYEDEEGNALWVLDVSSYESGKHVIEVKAI